MRSPLAASDRTLETLRAGEIDVLGLLPYSSNYVFLARLQHGDHDVLAVYKPQRGERSLWDFPEGTLAAREVGAFVVSQAAGWGLVPPTVLRNDAPMGPGSFQEFIEHDPERHFFTLAEERFDEFRAFAALDAVINNADRKGGHVLEDAERRLWGVDHGLSFNLAPKLRTVIWAFAGEPIDAPNRQLIESLTTGFSTQQGWGAELGELLSPAEARATFERAAGLLQEGAFPCPQTSHHLPWPLV